MNEMTPKPPPRHETQQGPVSAKTDQLLKLYRRDLDLHYAERTVGGYLAHVRELLAWLDERQLPLNEVKADDLMAYQAGLLALRKNDGRPYSLGFQINWLSAIKSFFRFLYRRRFLLQDPAAPLEFPRAERKLPRTLLTPLEARRIIEAAKENTPLGLRDRAILETLYATGLRVSELANLGPYDVDTEERTLRVVRGKGGKSRNVPLTAAAASAVEAYLRHGRPQLVRSSKAPYLFIGARGGRIHRAIFSRIIRRYLPKARVSKRVTCHTFRHSMATHLLRGRADIRHIQVLLGHSCLSTTERYTRVEISDLREVIDRAHPRR
jgi:integrase/recombinase XerD